MVKCFLSAVWSHEDQMTGVAGIMRSNGRIYWDRDVRRGDELNLFPATEGEYWWDCNTQMMCEKERERERRGQGAKRNDRKWGWGGNGGGGEREINGMRKLITSIVVPKLWDGGIVEERRNAKRERRRERWSKCAFILRFFSVVEERSETNKLNGIDTLSTLIWNNKKKGWRPK